MTEFVKTVSQLVENQFPSFYKEDGPGFVAFVKAYYEFLETTDKYTYKENRELFNSNDIDDTLSEFLVHFKEKYLADFPFITATDKRFMIKHITDYYQSKGSKQSLELLMRLLYNEEVDIYIPAEDILKPSDSEWYTPIYIEVGKSPRTRGFVNKQITGTVSGATAFVEGIVTKRVDGKFIDVVYLSSVRGNFRTNERVTDDGVVKDAPKIIGSLTSLTVELGGRNNVIGDIFDVVTTQGRQGKVRINGIENNTGKVDFAIVEGGYGYTNSTSSETATSVYVSDAILYTNNSTATKEYLVTKSGTNIVTKSGLYLTIRPQPLSFIKFEPVVQRIETLRLYNATNVNSIAVLGDYLVGYSGAGSLVANGYIISIANTDSSGNTVSGASDYSTVKVQAIGDTTFRNQKKLTLSSAKAYSVGEYIDEESTVILSVSSNTGFSVDDAVSQTFVEPANNTITGKAFGLVQSSTANTIIVKESWGTFVTTQSLIKTSTPTVNCSITAVNTSNTGARGLVTNVTGSNVSIRIVYGTFNDGNKIRGNRTKLIGTISSNTNTGAADVRLNGEPTASGAVDTVANNYVTGIVVGSNTTAVGIYGNTAPFFYANTGIFRIETTRETLASPPRDGDGNIIELNKNILGIATGTSADFKVGFIENAETITLNTDMVGANNTANTPFVNVMLNGANSGVGFVDALYIGTNLTVGSGEADNFILRELVTQTSSGATGKVIFKNNSTIRVYDVTGTFVNGQVITGSSSLSTATVSAVTNNGGTGYTNGTGVSFSGGGFADGEPFVNASGTITANGSGTITSITMGQPGQGYYGVPTFNIGSTSGTVANVMINMDFGYGFVKNPNADNGTFIALALNNENFTIGSIASLTRINPGVNYNADPFVAVYNKYIASYGRRNFFMNVSNINGSFRVGELLTQIIDGTGTAKGKVLAYTREGNTGTISVERNAFNIAFQSAYPITGATTGTTANVGSIVDDDGSLELGNNAVVTGRVIAANGIATSVEVIDSGYGYIPNGDVTLEREGFDFIITGKSNVTRQGVGEGYWQTTTSHLNSEKKIEDNLYYQEYSYDVISRLSLNRYENILKKVFHVSGNKMFGSVSKNSKIDSQIIMTQSSIQPVAIVKEYLVTKDGTNIVTKTGSYITVRTEPPVTRVNGYLVTKAGTNIVTKTGSYITVRNRT